MAAHAELVSDLKALRKGRGLYVNNVGERVGHTLRDLCGVTEKDGPGEIRVRVAQRLEHLAVDLPDDLRIAVLAAMGLIPAARCTRNASAGSRSASAGTRAPPAAG
jgi:hypothetical protein